MSVISQNSSWPGERDPTHQDVASANELPDPAFLSDFKRNLMSSGDAVGSENLLHMSFRDRQPLSKKYTYPLALLSGFPGTPTDERLLYLSQVFSRICLKHIFFDHFPIPVSLREPVAPPLRLGVGCLASVYDRGDVEEAQKLFSAGTSLWMVMVEVDNGLARSVEMLLGAVLLIPYGVLAATEPLQRISTLMLTCTLTIARRMRLHDPGQLGSALGQRISSLSSLLWSLWLWDVLHALRSNLSLNFSTNELLSKAPSSPVPFQDIYQDLLDDSGSNAKPLLLSMEGCTPELSVLLLLAILSDSITIRRALGNVASLDDTTQRALYRHNPFIPLSARTELSRMERQLSTALDRWNNKFATSSNPEILALYHYSRLYLSCSFIANLSQYVQTCSSSLGESHSESLELPADLIVSDRSVSQAWALLDVAATCRESQGISCPAWMPIIVFHASLVVWAKTKVDAASDGDKSGSLRALLAFKVELEAMPWPCCPGMALTLQNMMSS